MLGDVLHQHERRIGHDAFHPPVGIEAAALPAGMPREGTNLHLSKVQGTSENWGFHFGFCEAGPFGNCI